MSTNYELELEQMFSLRSNPIKALLIAITIVLAELQKGGMAV